LEVANYKLITPTQARWLHSRRLWLHDLPASFPRILPQTRWLAQIWGKFGGTALKIA